MEPVDSRSSLASGSSSCHGSPIVSTVIVRSPSRSYRNVNDVVTPPVESDAGRPSEAALEASAVVGAALREQCRLVPSSRARASRRARGTPIRAGAGEEVEGQVPDHSEWPHRAGH
jgi:hypothetical protein